MDYENTLKTCKKDFYDHKKGWEYAVFPTNVYKEDKHFEYITNNGRLMSKEFYVEHFYTGKIAYFLE